MAKLLGAKEVIGFDIEEWAVQNALENIELNHCSQIQILQATVKDIDPQEKFDIILANINKNVLLDEMSHYASLLQVDAYLLLSGFYEADVADILAKAQSLGLSLDKQSSKNDWTALILKN
jgi:ribosomal protein L11 methyltransferase